MRVICIENSLCVDEDNLGAIVAYKGSIYHVVNTVDGTELRKRKPTINFASGSWYEFLEIEGLHHHIRFLEIPDDDLENDFYEITYEFEKKDL
jgi:hypothetical protein